MAIKTAAELKAYFETGDVPTQQEFVNLIDTIFSMSGYTETIVNISSSQILNMGTTPIELLPAAGVNKYYDIEQITFEYTYGTTSYNVPDSDFIRISDYGTINFSITARVIAEGENRITIVKDFYSVQDGIIDVIFQGITTVSLNKGLYLEPTSGNPTNGDGTLRAIIKYKVKTFGE
jgi:hypothetical protein